MPTASGNHKSSYKRSTKVSILDLPDELLLKIYAFSNAMVNVICLALSCKRLCGVYQHFVDKKDRKQENFVWNSINGNWKQQLVPLLAKGWIPKDRVRVCWGCWRFLTYGPVSRAQWVKQLGHECCLHVQIQRVERWLQNWEIRTWLGEIVESADGTLVSARDKRIRCPSCTVKDFPVKLLMRNSEVRRREKTPRLEEMSVLLDMTRPKRHWHVSRWNGVSRDISYS